MPAAAGQAGYGQDGAAGRDGRGGQVHADLGVVPDGVLGFGQPAAGGLEPLGVQLPGAPGGFLGGSLAGVRDDPGQAARGGGLAALPVPAGLLDLGVDLVAVSRRTSAAAALTARSAAACSAASCSS